MTQQAEVIPFSTKEVEVFSEFRSQLAKLKDDNSKAVFDYASPKGNKEARSHIYGLRQTKAALEKARKEAKDAALQYGRLVDSSAKEIKEELESMIEVHEAPLREIEEEEAARVQAIQDRIASLSAYEQMGPDSSAEMLEQALQEVEAFVLDDSLQEFREDAALGKDAAINALKARIAARKQYEDEQAELERLRREAEERAQKDREAEIARQAEERAKREATEEAERQRAEAAKAEEEKEKQRQMEAREKELELERTKREKLEAEQRVANAERIARENAEREQAEREAAAKAEAEKREANKKHHAKVNNAAVDGLVKAGLSKDDAVAAVTAIAKRSVPHVTISY